MEQYGVLQFYGNNLRNGGSYELDPIYRTEIAFGKSNATICGPITGSVCMSHISASAELLVILIAKNSFYIFIHLT